MSDDHRPKRDADVRAAILEEVGYGLLSVV